MTYKIGIIGCGGIAAAHVAGWQANGQQITAMADIDPTAAQKLAEDIDGVEIFENPELLLDSGLVDIVSICTPPVAHEEPAVAALKRNIDILLEKPMANNLESANSIMAAHDQSSSTLMMAFRHRFLPSNVKLKEIVDQGLIGPLVHFRNVFCGPAFNMKDRWFSKKDIAGGGTLMDTSIHSIDLFRYLAGEVVDQKAVMHQHLEGTDVEDASIMILKAENGAVGALTASWVAGDGVAFIDIMGQDGRVVYDYATSDKICVKLRDEDEWQTISVESSNGFKEQIAHMIRALEGQEPLRCTIHDGLRAAEIVEAVY